MRNVLVSLALLAACACNPDLGRVVWLVGDSISTRMLEELHFKAAGRDKGDLVVPVASIPCSALGRDLSYFTRRIESVRERLEPDAVVISLGTNDVGEGEDNPIYAWPHIDTPEELQAALDALLGSLPDVPVLWIVPASPLSPTERLAYFRAQLEAAQQRWPKLHLLEQSQAWFADGDGVHHSPVGEGEAAKALVAALDAL